MASTTLSATSSAVCAVPSRPAIPLVRNLLPHHQPRQPHHTVPGLIRQPVVVMLLITAVR